MCRRKIEKIGQYLAKTRTKICGLLIWPMLNNFEFSEKYYKKISARGKKAPICPKGVTPKFQMEYEVR